MRHGSLPKRCAVAALLLATLVPHAVHAGPPYVTDDPEPTEPGHWEIFAFAEGMESRAETEGEAGLDINYGLAPGVQLTAVLPLSYEDEGRARLDVGDVELAVKYRFLSQREGSILPDIAFFPAITLPTGSGPESSRVRLFRRSGSRRISAPGRYSAAAAIRSIPAPGTAITGRAASASPGSSPTG